MPIRRNGRWGARVYDPASGRQVWLGTYDLKKDAERKEREAKRDLDLGQFTKRERMTLSDFIARWFDSLNVRSSTLDDYHITCRHIVRALGNRSLSSITTEDLDQFLAAFGKTHSPATVRKTATRLRQVFGRAVAWGYLTTSPAERLHNIPRKPRPRPLRLLDPEQVRTLIEATPDYWRPLVMTALLTGLRRSELFGLRWTDILWAEQRVRVRVQLQNGALVAPKSDSALRSIEVGPALLATLSEHRRTCPRTELDLVFASPSGTPVHASDFYRDVFRPLAVRARVPDLTLHDLRHTYASALIAQGESIKYVQSVMGHASAQTTLDVYGHLFDNGGRKAARTLERNLLSEQDVSAATAG